MSPQRQCKKFRIAASANRVVPAKAGTQFCVPITVGGGPESRAAGHRCQPDVLHPALCKTAGLLVVGRRICRAHVCLHRAAGRRRDIDLADRQARRATRRTRRSAGVDLGLAGLDRVLARRDRDQRNGAMKMMGTGLAF